MSEQESLADAGGIGIIGPRDNDTETRPVCTRRRSRSLVTDSSLVVDRYRRWCENRIGPWFHGYLRWGWQGNGWNGLHLGFVTFWLESGPSPFARLKKKVGRG